MNVIFIVMWLVSIAFSVLIGAVAITYIRRTWQLIRAEEDDPTRERLLDGIDHLENQMHLVAERLGSMEDRLAEMEGRLEDGDRDRLPSGGATGGEAGSHPRGSHRPGSQAGATPEAGPNPPETHELPHPETTEP